MFTIPNGSLIHVPVYKPKSYTYVAYPATTTHRRGRIYYFTGLQGAVQPMQWPVFPEDAAGIPPSYLLSLVQLFQEDGWEVILAPDPRTSSTPVQPSRISGKWLS